GVRPLPSASEARGLTPQAALRSLRALGVARAPHIRAHFTRNRYPGLAGVLEALHAEGTIERVAVEGLGDDWWVHAADLDLLRALARDEHPWRPRTAVLSPFDNLLCDRARTELLFGFHHRLEIYVPREKRRWGYFVLPILHGDRLIGRADLAADVKGGVLRVHAIYAEPGTARAGGAVRRQLERLARWRGTPALAFADPGGVPAPWRDALLDR
ncbi:MAG TPA: crosslink repair DNA glycosylase YcaQ family protein, partial [Solirubrobacteraceae bacterium]